MKQFRRPTPERTDDDGQGLLFALMFLALFGLWITGVLGLATTDLTSASTVRNQRVTTYAADSAVWGAIELERNQTSNANLVASCPVGSISSSPVFQYQDPSFSGSSTYYVSCLSTAIPNNPINPFPGYPGYYVQFYASTSSSPTPANATVIASVTYTTASFPATYSVGFWADGL